MGVENRQGEASMMIGKAAPRVVSGIDLCSLAGPMRKRRHFGEHGEVERVFHLALRAHTCVDAIERRCEHDAEHEAGESAEPESRCRTGRQP